MQWTLDNPFISVPKYREPQYSEQVQQEILWEHNFAHVIHKLCILFGKRFERKDSPPEPPAVFYVLPGEGYWDNSRYEKVIFEIGYNPKAKKIFHAFAAPLSPLQLAQRYIEDKCFPEQYQGEGSEVQEAPREMRDILPDDGSWVDDFFFNGQDDGEEYITVRDPKNKVTFKLHRFPNIF